MRLNRHFILGSLNVGLIKIECDSLSYHVFLIIKRTLNVLKQHISHGINQSTIIMINNLLKSTKIFLFYSLLKFKTL